MITYYAKFEPAPEGGYVVSFPDLRNAATQGDTIQEAEDMAVDAIRTLFWGLINAGEELPPPGKTRSRRLRPVSLPALESAKVELYRAWKKSAIRKSQLAAGMGIPRSHIDRLFNLNHRSRLDQIEAAFRVLGKRFVVSVEDAA